MTRDDIYTAVTSLLGGYEMDTTLFNSLLDKSQMKRENQRPWVILRKADSSLSASPADTFTTAKTLPTDFRKWYTPESAGPVVLTDANNNPWGYREVSISEKFAYRNIGGVFYTDYVAGNFYLCGPITQAYTINLFYIKKSTLVSADATNSWAFPSEYHMILAFDVAVMWKGIDYDVINNQNAQILAAQAQEIYDEMSRWDSDLQIAMQAGIDSFASMGGGWEAGRVPGSLM